MSPVSRVGKVPGKKPGRIPPQKQNKGRGSNPAVAKKITSNFKIE